MEITDQGASSPELTAVLDTQEAGGIAIRGSALRLAGYGVSVLLSVVAVAALTRHLGARDYGRLSVVQSLVAIAAGLAEAGMVNVGIREYAVRNGRDRDAMLANLQGVRIVLGAAGVGLGFLFGLAAGYDGTMLAGVALTGAGVVLAAVQATLGIPLSAGLRWKAVTALDVLRQVLQVALVLALVASGAGLFPFFLVPLPIGALVLLATIPLVRRSAPVMPAFDRQRWRELLRLVAPYAAATAVGSVYVYVAAVLMELVSTPDEVGWFAASFRVFVVLGGIPLLVVGAVFPILARAARDDRTRHAYATERLITTAIIGGAWLALMTALLAKVAIDVVAGSKFGPSVEVLRIQALAVLASFLVIAVTHVLISLARYRDLLVLSGCALVLSAVLTLVLAPGMGAQGGAVANAGGEGLSALLGLAFLVRAQDGLKIPWATAAKVALAAAAGGAPALVPGLPDIPTAVAATIVFAAVLLLLRAIPDELLDAVPLLRR
jgi:O-antigen/teichoic acid export membrane protein